MRRIIVIILIGIAMSMEINISKAQPVSYLRDPYKNRQLENMVFMRWGSFRPRWYYILFHNQYRRGPDRRTLLQLAPTDLILIQTRNKSEDTEEESKQLFDMQTMDALNRAAETHYHLHFSTVFQKLNTDIDLLIAEGIAMGADPSATASFVKEKERLNGEIGIIRDGWLEKGDSAEAMKDIETDLRSLKSRLIRFNYLQSVSKKYHNITKPDDL